MNPSQVPSLWEQLLPFALIFVVFYFFIIRPQAKKMKDHQSLLQNLKRGDSVITSGGILGTIEGLTEKFVTLEIDQNVRIKVLKTQVSGLAKEKTT